MANSVYPDQTATLESGSALFGLACLSKNLRSLQPVPMAIRLDWVFHFLRLCAKSLLSLAKLQIGEENYTINFVSF